MTGILEQSTIDALSAPLDAKHVKHRQQAGQKLSYIESWHAIAEANRIFGFDRWSREIVEMRCVWEGTIKTRNGERDACSYVATVRVTVFDPETGKAVVRHGTGAGHGMGSHPGEAHESAVKEAESDSMKRALMTFGWPFGLALYDKAQSHVESNGSAKHEHSAPAQPPPGTAPLDDVPSKPGEIGHDGGDSLDGYMLLGADGRELGTYTHPIEWFEEYAKQIRAVRDSQSLQRLRAANQKIGKRIRDENQNDNELLDLITEVTQLVNERKEAFEKDAA